MTLSPQAAQSVWVNREISYWLERRGREHLMLVVASGQLHWDEGTARLIRKHQRRPVGADPARIAAG